jgi:hypothetical protein
MMDARTFGDAPAAMYLVELLNQRANPLLTRKVSKVLATGRETLNELGNAHLEYDTLSTRAFARLLTLISDFNQGQAVAAIKVMDPFIAHLVTNVLEGGVKMWKRRVQDARRQQSSLARNIPEGITVQCVLAKPSLDEKDSRLLQARSKRYLQRKGKLDTLY